MKKCVWIALLLAGSCVYSAEPPTTEMEWSFVNPPDSAKPYTWWHWINGNISKEGITADLEAMSRVGIGGFHLFNVSSYTPAGAIPYWSDAWWAMVKHALKESDRLGLDAGLNNCAGWSASGGPWITPATSMKKVVWTEKQISGPGSFSETLAQPEQVNGYYEEIGVIAFPTPAGELQDDGFRISDWKAKAAFERKVPLTPDTRQPGQDQLIGKNEIMILSDRMDSSGQLNWTVPKGQWTVLRFGCTTTGKQVAPAPPGGDGLECDKMNPEIVDLQWENSVQKILDESGPVEKKVLTNVLLDSFEAKCQNWTQKLPEEFLQRTGYDLIRWLPALTGRVVDSPEMTERFLWDFRRTLGELITEHYFGRFADLCHRNNLLLTVEPYGNGNMDEFAVSKYADIPMGEFWAHRGRIGIYGCHKLAASTAHTYARKVVAAEAFTSGPYELPEAAAYINHPYLLKTQGDHFFCKGINRLFLHTYVHQPYDDVKPGFTLGIWGSHFDRHNTWYNQSTAWMSYLSRCQYLLQEGTFVADLCYFAGEQAPSELPPREKIRPQPPEGYDYDYCNVDNFLRMEVENGQLILPGGMKYRVLILPQGAMRPEILQKISDLIRDGAVVYGSRPPCHSPGLVDYPACDADVARLNTEIWGPTGADSENKPGAGKVVGTGSLDELLAAMSIPPDFEFSGGDNPARTRFHGSGIDTIHRTIDGADVYFISNQHEAPKSIRAIFRVNGKQPELWDPATGQIKEVLLYSFTEDGRTSIPLSLDPAGSLFVVFRKPADEKTRIDAITESAGRVEIIKSDGTKETILTDAVSDPISLDRSWTLQFPSGWGAPEQIELSELIDWTHHENYDIRHFSGTATYTRTFELSAEQLRADEFEILDLGVVHAIAQVKLNGNDLGILWKPPFCVDVSETLKEGENILEIEVTNPWANRLIGDEKYPQDSKRKYVERRKGSYVTEMPEWIAQGTERPVTGRRTFVFWQQYKADHPLFPAGLLGPVTIRAAVDKMMP